MDDQLSLLEWTATPKARKRGPSTSKEAARRAMAWATPQANALLLLISEASGGLTRAELIHLSGVKESSACARLKDMSDGGIIEVRGVRMGPYGTEQQVYHATAKGQARAKVLREMRP
jgi:hypothetical protein